MSHDDMHVIMYRILAYLYKCMKDGERPEGAMWSCEALCVNKPYWSAVVAELAENGYVRGVSVVHGDAYDEVYLAKPRVTMAGVEFLMENSMMHKAKSFLQDAKASIPFI